jgi:hypothetical protein
MIHRTYVVRLPTALSDNGLDIIVEGPVGSPSAPVGVGVGFTAPPAGWLGGDGAFFEIRSRTLRIPVRAPGADPVPAGFVERLRLGWHLSIHPLVDTSGVPVIIPRVQYSRSLIQSIAPAYPTVVDLLDPTYGPVIRLGRDDVLTTNHSYVVQLAVIEQKDEDRDQQGSI